VNIQRKGRVSKKNFVYRYQARNEQIADLAVVSDYFIAVDEPTISRDEAMLAIVGAQSVSRRSNSKRSKPHWLPSHRHDGPAPKQVAPEGIRTATIIHVTAAMDQIDDPEMVHDTANIGPSVYSSGHALPRCPLLNCAVRDWTSSS
jgi:hypothetical protein